MDSMKGKLREEVKQMEILEYFEEKYETKNIVTQRTIRNWLNDLNISCIQPTPSRNADRRYNKTEVLKLEEMKIDTLLQRKLKSKQKKFEEESYKHRKIKAEKLFEEQRGKSIEAMEDHIEYAKSTSKNQLGDYLEYLIEKEAEEIIKKDKLERCFSKLFPNVIFNTEELKYNLLVKDNSISASDYEKFYAREYVENKMYISEK